MGDYLVLGVRHRRDVAPRHQGPFATRALVSGRGPELAAAAEAAVADTTWRGVGRGRNSFVIRIFDGHGVHRIIEGAGQIHQPGPVPAFFRLVWHLPDPPLSAAEALAALCDLVAADPTVSAREFVERLGDQAAGITPGWRGWVDLLRAGRNRIPGDGFRAEYDDGSHRQVRHFAGTTAAAGRLGSRGTRVASLLRGDLPTTPDHRLSLEAIEFTAALLSGRLPTIGAGDWVRTRLCVAPDGGGRSGPPGDDGVMTNPATPPVTTVETGPRTVSRRVQVSAPAAAIFDLVADPHRHPELDGSGTVRDTPVTGPDRLGEGSTFGVGMKQFGVPYKITSTVTAFEEDHLVEWRHPLGHRWRWELEQITPGTTLVTETFDYSTSKAAKVLELMGIPKQNAAGITSTLEALAARFA